MTQEERELLLKDLCARLRCGVIVKAQYKDGEGWKTEDRKLKGIYEDGQVYVDCVYTNIENIKPYLRPMSSMTDEEDEWLNDRINFSKDDEVDKIRQKWGIVLQEIYTNSSKYIFSNFTEILDWLNVHHFDYRGLIPMGLALEAPEGMYNN